MIPLTLTLKNFLSYRDEERVDLSLVDVACVSGANGAGKSSLFDAMTWALFGRARRSDDALIHGNADACAVALEFSYEDAVYRVQREKPRGKGTSLEFQVRAPDGSWKPLTEAGVRATEDRIRGVLRLDYDTFVNASFFLQGKADMFAQQTAGRRKEILGSILGLEVWESYREEASVRRRAIANDVKSQRAFLADIQVELGEEDARRERLALLQDSLKNAEAARLAQEQAVKEARARKQEADAEQEKLALLEKRAQESSDALARVIAQETQTREELGGYEQLLEQATEIEKRHQDWVATREQVSALSTLAEEYHQLVLERSEANAAIEAEKARLEQEQVTLQERGREINVLAKALPEKEQELVALSESVSELEDRALLQEAAEKELVELQQAQIARTAENESLRAQMKELEGRIHTLQEAQGADCPLCGQDLSETHRATVITELEAQGKALGDQFRENQVAKREAERKTAAQHALLETLSRTREQLAKEQAQLQALADRIDEDEKRKTEWMEKGRTRLEEVGKLLASGGYSVRAQAQLARLEEKIAKLGYDAGEHAAAREQESALRGVEEAFQKLGEGRAAVDGLRRQMATLAAEKLRLEKDVAEKEADLSELQAELAAKAGALVNVRELEDALSQKRIEENQLRTQVGGAKQMVDVLAVQRGKAADLEESIQEMNHQITHLRVLETAFGNDGIPAMLIEEALPEIEAQANEILDRLSDGRMSVSIETERAYKDASREDKKQTLDILIRDASGTREYELFSGGEAFRINFAIRLALSRVLAGRAGARLQTLVIDEGFGSQDAEGRQRLVEAINLVSPDFAKILVITHLDELKDVFPARIEVTKTNSGSKVAVMA